MRLLLRKPVRFRFLGLSGALPVWSSASWNSSMVSCPRKLISRACSGTAPGRHCCCSFHHVVKYTLSWRVSLSLKSLVLVWGLHAATSGNPLPSSSLALGHCISDFSPSPFLSIWFVPLPSPCPQDANLGPHSNKSKKPKMHSVGVGAQR